MTDASDLTHFLDYCERAGDPGLWGEPLNAVTNLAFILFAGLSMRLMLRQPSHSFKKYGDIWMLVLAQLAIGIGSGLWHLFATDWAVMADVIPIYVFINVYIFSLFIRCGGLRWPQAMAIWVAFQIGSVLAELYIPKDVLNGSIMYIPSFAMLLIGIGWLKYIGAPAWRMLAATTALFTLSISLRTVDLTICGSFPLGTHFMWHLLNAIVLYRLVKMVILQPKKL